MVNISTRKSVTHYFFKLIIKCLMIRSKKLYWIYLLIVLLNIILFITLKPIPIIKTIVYETNKKINNIQAFKASIEENDQTYLEYLGFSDVNGNHSKLLETIVIGSAVSSFNFNHVFAFIDSLNISLSSIYDSIILFDTGLRSWHINQLKKKCNKTNNCQIRNFEFEKFPNHISHLNTKSFKPLAVQMLLKEFLTIIWIDLSEPQFLPLNDILLHWRNIANYSQSDIKGWPITWPTSSVTHPKMFEFFKLKSEQFYFHRMMSTKYFIISRSDFVKKKIMLPWVKCTLSNECIEPLGSKNSGCDFHREPHFLYSGCHWYEMSAFNVVLGLAYNMNTSGYLLNFPTDFRLLGTSNTTMTQEFYLNNAF